VTYCRFLINFLIIKQSIKTQDKTLVNGIKPKININTTKQEDINLNTNKNNEFKWLFVWYTMRNFPLNPKPTVINKSLTGILIEGRIINKLVLQAIKV
jgi:hypothetical protein